MTYILIHSENLPDVEAFTRLFSLFVSPSYEGQNIGEKVGTFEIIFSEEGMKLSQDLQENFFEKLVTNNDILQEENNRLKAELELLKPNQNLSINEMLYRQISKLRSEQKKLSEIADILNKKGFLNGRGNKLNTMQISRLIKKYETPK